jgi:hypothetical protein
MDKKALGRSPLSFIRSTNKPLPISAAIDKLKRPAQDNTKKPDKPHIYVELYANQYSAHSNKAVVSVNQIAGVVFLPQVAGVFFGSDSHERADQLAHHINTVSGLEIVKSTRNS